MSEAQKNFIKKKKVEKIFITIIQLFISIIFLFVWEYLSSHKIINSFIFSSPSKIVKTIYIIPIISTGIFPFFLLEDDVFFLAIISPPKSYSHLPK